MLLDKNNYVRWMGSGTAEPQEIKTLFDCTEQLLEESRSSGSDGNGRTSDKHANKPTFVKHKKGVKSY
jgi:hypothetical protein